MMVELSCHRGPSLTFWDGGKGETVLRQWAESPEMSSTWRFVLRRLSAEGVETG